MTKEDVVKAQVEAIQAAELAALEAGLGAAYDEGAAAQKESDGTFQQADIDAAVAAALEPVQAQLAEVTTQLDAANAQLAIDQGVIEADAQALADAQAKAAADIAEVQAALEAMTAKELMEEQAVANVQAKILAVQASFDAIKAILVPNG